MDENYFEGISYKGLDFSKELLLRGEYENCTFSYCIFSGVDISAINFIECQFENCDLSNAKINDTAFRDVSFRSCKLMGLRFEDCNPFLLSMNFESSVLNFSSFYKLKLKNTSILNCNLEEVDFTEADLIGSLIRNCNLGGAIFHHTILDKVDFRDSYNFSIDPENNKVKKAKFSMKEVMGLLNKYEIIVE